MCGITGYISDAKPEIKTMLDSLHHRGPDHSGVFTINTLSKNIFLGHTRLGIIDLSPNGNQPMLSRDGQNVLVFNGEIYNFGELKAKYFPGEEFCSRTDTEVVLKMYQKFGIGFIEKLNGDFAFALYDRSKEKIFLVRDRLGVKPLYYCHSEGQFVFASEIKSILAAGVKPEISLDEIQKYFVFKYTPQNNTLFKNIFRVPPASYIEFSIPENKWQTHIYWTLQKSTAYSDLAYEDAQQILYQLICDSTKMRLMADVPVGNFLSGGVDSSILASILKDRPDIKHYCAKKSAKDLKKEGTTSDFYYASRLAADWNLNLISANIGTDEANIELIRKTLFYSDDLIADGSQIPSYLLTKEAGVSSRVILSGMGADELFFGYAGHMLSLLAQNVTDKLPFGLSGAFYKSASKINQGKGKFLAYRRYIHKIGKYGAYPNYRFGIFNLVGDFENSCSVYSGNKEVLENMLGGYFPEGKDVFDCITRFELENVLVKNLHYMDRMSMANSVECRVPFLDHRIVEFAYSIPREYKLTNTGKAKRILKDAFRSKLPGYVLNRRKAGFGMPLRSIFSSQTNVERLLDRSFFSNFNGFSVENIDKLIRHHIEGKEDNSSIIYALVSFREWYEMNFTT